MLNHFHFSNYYQCVYRSCDYDDKVDVFTVLTVLRIVFDGKQIKLVTFINFNNAVEKITVRGERGMHIHCGERRI
jgi:hypothetical protein